MCNQPKFINIKEAHISVREDFNKLMSVIDNFNNSKLIPINSKDLNEFPVGVWVNVNNKVKVKKRKNRFMNYLNFDTEMESGGEFGKHFHEYVIESCEVLWGEIVDLEDGKIYTAGDVFEYAKGVKHYPKANKKTMLHVLFKP